MANALSVDQDTLLVDARFPQLNLNPSQVAANPEPHCPESGSAWLIAFPDSNTRFAWAKTERETSKYVVVATHPSHSKQS